MPLIPMLAVLILHHRTLLQNTKPNKDYKPKTILHQDSPFREQDFTNISTNIATPTFQQFINPL